MITGDMRTRASKLLLDMANAKSAERINAIVAEALDEAYSIGFDDGMYEANGE